MPATTSQNYVAGRRIATCADLARQFVRMIRQRDASCLAQLEGRRKRQFAGKLRKTPLPR